jgi:hypothetical protein
MPIRINLLAEAQAAEVERRRDPVKRGIIVAGAVISLVVFWAVVLQMRLFGAQSRLNRLESKWKAIEKSYEVAAQAQRSAMDAEQKLAALHQMTTNRFLWGSVLNGFQHTLNGIEDVQVVKLKTLQTYTIIEGTPNRTNGTTIVPGKPPTAQEKIQMTIDARDTSPQFRRVNQFKEAISGVPYFRDNLEKTNGVRLIGRGAPQSGGANGQQFVPFNLECNFPEKTR